MKIVVDYDLCEANAVCMDVCPECFRVEEDDTLTILVESPPKDLRGKVEEAVRRPNEPRQRGLRETQVGDELCLVLGLHARDVGLDAGA